MGPAHHGMEVCYTICISHVQLICKPHGVSHHVLLTSPGVYNRSVCPHVWLRICGCVYIADQPYLVEHAALALRLLQGSCV